MTERRPLGLAVVGAGCWGPDLVRNIVRRDDADLRWVCDLDMGRALRAVGRHGTARVTDSLEAVLDDPRVSAVVVATPTHTHAPIVSAALEANKHVLADKPLATSVAEGRKLVDAASRRGLVLMVDHTDCFTPTVQTIRQLVDHGELGEIDAVDSVRVIDGPLDSDADVFWDLASEDLAILDLILGRDSRPVGVSAQAADPIGAGRPGMGDLTLALANGGSAHVHVSRFSPTAVRTMRIGGSRRTVTLDLAAPGSPEREVLGRVINEFVAAIREWRPALTSGESGLRVIEVLDAAGRSLDQGGAMVPVSGLDRTPVGAA